MLLMHLLLQLIPLHRQGLERHPDWIDRERLRYALTRPERLHHLLEAPFESPHSCLSAEDGRENERIRV
jgi:hypothetical protein